MPQLFTVLFVMNSLCHGKYLPTEVSFSLLPGTKWVYQQHYCACAISPPALRKPFLAPGTEDSISKVYLSVQGLYGHHMGARCRWTRCWNSALCWCSLCSILVYRISLPVLYGMKLLCREEKIYKTLLDFYLFLVNKTHCKQRKGKLGQENMPFKYRG